MDKHLELLIDLHIDGKRQGPGSDDATRLALSLAQLDGTSTFAVADIGCGTGASTLVLAEQLDAHITAIDVLPPFLARLDDAARLRGLDERVTTLTASMDQLDMAEGSLDLIWSEGAIYHLGFELGVRSWKPLLRPGGVLAVSEIIWLTQDRPAELEQHWTAEYPGIATASAKLSTLEAAGYSPLGYFSLPETCWIEHYHRPMERRFAAFLDRHDHSPAAREIVAAEQHEIDLYERFSEFVGYGFFVARRTTD